MRLLIDFRENSRAKDAIAHFHYEPLIEKIDVLELPTGDFIFRNEEGKEVVFEYKTIPDFFSSINDNRIFNESIDQQREFEHHFVIVVGTTGEITRERNKRYQMGRGQVSKKQVMGVICSLNTYTTVIRADTQKEAFDYMLTQARKCFENKMLVKRFNKSEGNLAFRFLCYCVDGVGEKTAENLVFNLGLVTLDDLMNLTEKRLTSVDGVGIKTAKKIMFELRRQT